MRNRLLNFLVILLIGLFISQASFAQRRKVMNLPKYDKEAYHFGFILALNQMYYTSKPLINTRSTPGFAIGILGNLRLGEYFDFRFIPTLSFGGREVAQLSNPDFYYDIPSTFIDFPFNIKYRSKRLNNIAAYLLAGPKYSMDIASTKKKNLGGFTTHRSDLGFEVGVGFDFYTNYFKFGTEVKMGYGIFNILKSGSDNIGTDQLRNKIFQLSFTFE
ncbi:MAG: outer membrane beta-barrel protein [Bacteroidales bacterium]|nr:outer membrane beta-barrel protein [Bacteroidales bacterium]